jgi:hypothetical protein
MSLSSKVALRQNPDNLCGRGRSRAIFYPPLAKRTLAECPHLTQSGRSRPQNHVAGVTPGIRASAILRIGFLVIDPAYFIF